MYSFSIKNPRRIFLTIFMPFVFCIVGIIILVTAILFTNFKNITQDMVYKSNMSQLESISQSAKNMNDTLRTISLQIFFDDTLKDILYFPIGDNPTTPYSRRLYSYKNAFSLIDSIYIYNGSDFYVCPALGFTYEKDTFQDADIVKILDDMKTYHSNTIIPRYVDTTLIGEITNRTFIYSYLFYDSQLQQGKIEQAVILNVSEDFLQQSIDSFNDSDSNIQIISKSGLTMKEDLIYPAMTNLSNEKYIAKILGSNQTSGYFIENVDGKKSLISYVNTDIMNWRFVSVTPYDQVIADITRMRTYTLIVALLILLIGVILAIWLSKKLFVPVKSMALDSDTLKNEKRTNYSYKKQKIIAGLVLDKPVISSGQYSEFNIKLDTSKPFCLLLIKIDHFDAFCSKYNLEDRNLMKFGIANVAEELLSARYVSESADMGAASILVLMNKSDHAPVTDILKEIQDNVRIHLDLSITIAVGSMQCAASELADEYSSVVKASEFRMISGHGSIVFANDVYFKSATDFTYPDDKEKELIESLMLGQTDNANVIIKEVIAYSALFGRSTLDACLLSLLLAINNAILIIERNSMVSIHFNFDEFVDRIRHSEMLDEYSLLFSGLFASLSIEMEDSRKNRHEKLIEQVISIIEDKYALQNLCLDDISGIVKVSPYYLTKLFKKYKLISISDYINKVRLEKAKTMIQGEDIPIRLVMEKTGFTSRSHFYTLFRKVYGVSPNQFRNIV